MHDQQLWVEVGQHNFSGPRYSLSIVRTRRCFLLLLHYARIKMMSVKAIGPSGPALKTMWRALPGRIQQVCNILFVL